MKSNEVQSSKPSSTAKPNNAQLELSSSFTAWLIIELEQLNKKHKQAITLEYFINHVLEQLDIDPTLNPFFLHLDELDSFYLFGGMLQRLFTEVKIMYLEQANWITIDQKERLIVTHQVEERRPYIESLIKTPQVSTCPGKFSDKSIINMIKRCINDLKLEGKHVSYDARSLKSPRIIRYCTMEDYANSLSTLKEKAETFERAVAALGDQFEDKKQLFFADQASRLLLTSVTKSLGLENKYAAGLNIEGKHIPMFSTIELLPAITEFKKAIDDFLPKFNVAVKTHEAYSATSLASQTFHAVQQKLREVFKATDNTAIMSFYIGSNTTNPGVQWTEKGRGKTAALGGLAGRPKKDSYSSIVAGHSTQADNKVTILSR